MTTPTSQVFRMLIADDEDSVRGFVTRVMQLPGHETATAADGFEALRLAETKGPFDLLVTDLVMPGMSGDELARRLRTDEPDLKVLYLTGYSDRLFQGRVLLSDSEAFLEKPVTVQALLEATSLLLVGHLPPPRAVRVNVPGACVRLPTDLVPLVNLSATGALVNAGVEMPVGTTWPLVIELPLEAIVVTGRVVRCQSTVSGNEKRYAVAMTFVEPTAEALRALQRVCCTDSAILPR